MAGILSKGIKLGYSTSGTSPVSYTDVSSLLQEVPAMGGSADKVDVTTLADGNYKYINGIKDFGDIEFTFLFDSTLYNTMYGWSSGETPSTIYFQVEFPDALTGTGTHHGTRFTFSGQTSVATASASVNGALQFTLTITLNSDIVVSQAA